MGFLAVAVLMLVPIWAASSMTPKSTNARSKSTL